MAIAFEDSRRALEQQLSTKLDVVHLVLLVFLTTLVVWAVTGDIDVYRTSKSGILKNRSGTLIVQSKVTSTIQYSNLALGMRVNRGDLLVQLDDTTAQITLSKLQDELIANAKQQAILNEQMLLTKQKYQLLETGLRSEIKGLQTQLEQSQLVLKTEKNIQDAFHALNPTSAVARMDSLRQDLEVVKAEYIIKENTLSLDHKKQEIPRNLREQDLAISHINRQLSALTDQKDQLNRAIARAQLEVDKYAIVAAGDGEVVQLIPLSFGNIINKGGKIATISNGSEWLIHSKFDAKDAVGHVKQGQTARILVDGFPWRQYGSLSATVSHVAKEGLNDQVDVLLQLRDNPDSQIPLTFGQPVTVEIKTQSLSPLMLLLNAADRSTRSVPKEQK